MSDLWPAERWFCTPSAVPDCKASAGRATFQERGKPHRRNHHPMAIHLTPTELARESGLERRQVIEKCMEMGVPIFQGRIDKTRFLANLSEDETADSTA